MNSKIKFMLLSLMAAFMVSCSHDFEQYTPQELVTNAYNKAFIANIGTPAKTQTWGFGTATMLTRAASTWTDKHSDDWFDKLNVVLPEGATEMTSPGWLSTGVYVVPTNGSVSLGWANFNEGDKIYILGNVTELKEANYSGVVTFYNVGTLTYSVSSGNRHTIINTGTLTIDSYGNVGEVYNSGTLVLKGEPQYDYSQPWPFPITGYGPADIPNAMSIFSTGEGSVLMPDGGDFKAAADIHGTLVADANTKIQNDETQYICGIKVDGVLDMTQGHLQASMIEATDIDFDGAEIQLTAGGHVKAEVIRMPNSATAIHGEGASTGLIEVKDVYFGNTNNFDATFSDNIYFQISGAIDFSNSTKFGGGAKHYNNVAAYNADNTPLKGYNEGDYTEGTPTCGQPWTVGTPNTEVTPDPDPEPDNWEFICRIFAEDLSASNGSDFDFNDVVFDVYNNAAANKAKIVLKAAGGTLPLYVEGVEVHDAFGVSVTTMVNTNANGGQNGLTANDIELDHQVTSPAEAKDIRIIVEKHFINEIGKTTVNWIELYAEQGSPAAKFAVTSTDVQWCNEREDITKVYPKFVDWVRNGGDFVWWE